MFKTSVSIQRHRCILHVVILAFIFATSLIYGIFTSYRDLSVVVLMRLTLASEVSIVGLFVVLILPLLITIISVNYRCSIVIYILSMLKGFSIGYCTCGIALSYGSAGWLIDFLFFFSDFFATLILFWFWFRLIYLEGNNLKRDGVVSVLSASLIGIIDYFVVAPFGVSLANQL